MPPSVIPAKVAGAVLHLAADESSFTTGSVFLVDGGLTAM
ncbi:MAG: SDR family oxidoreductase [bacterium]|nr:SDR family oxidoreductase [bacterium]MCY3807147.1 SDR family oxidoreductase [bacterium]